MFFSGEVFYTEAVKNGFYRTPSSSRKLTLLFSTIVFSVKNKNKNINEGSITLKLLFIAFQLTSVRTHPSFVVVFGKDYRLN